MPETRDTGLIPGLGRSPGEGNGNPLQSSCLENPMDRGAWRATAREVTKSRTEQACTGHCLSSSRPRQLLKMFVPENKVHNTAYFSSEFNQHLPGTQYWVSCWVLGKQIKKVPVLTQLPLQARGIPLKHIGILKEFLGSFCLHQNFSIFNF